jgi:toxin ParE1/3/4
MSAAEKISITLTPEMNRMIKERVEAGDYGSTSELIREALRLWQRREEAEPRGNSCAVAVFDRWSQAIIVSWGDAHWFPCARGGAPEGCFVKKRRVRFLAVANAELKSIFDWIVDASGHPIVAEKFIMRIIDRCEQLGDFPELGVARDDLLEGMRLLAFERRAAIFYRITADEIQIVNIFYKGRDYDDFTFQI